MTECLMIAKYRLGLLSVFLLAESGCHGGGAGSGLPSVTSPAALSRGSGTAAFTVAIPPGSGPAAQSVIVSLTKVNALNPPAGVAPVVMNLTRLTPGCESSPDGTLSCTATITAPAGSDSFSVVTRSGLRGQGSQVSSTSATATITTGGRTTCTQTPSGPPANTTSIGSKASPAPAKPQI